MKKTALSIFTLYLVFNSIMAQSDTSSFPWPANYKAAVCLTYDDGLDCHIDVAAPALDAYGLKGTFYCTGNSPSLHSRMDAWRAITKNGHELGNHSLFHPCDGSRFDWVKPEYDLRTYSIAQIKNELYTANSLLFAVDGREARTYAYTCSDYKAGKQSFVDSIRPMFLAARSDGPIPEFIAGMDLHFVPSWGVDDPTGEELINYVEQAREKGTLAVIMFHNVGGGYLNVTRKAHDKLLAYLAKNKKEIWTDTFLNVMKYINENR